MGDRDPARASHAAARRRGFLLASAVASLALTVTFQLSHCLEEAVTIAPAEGAGAEWHVHQVEATADFAQRNTVIRWYVGGLNHQIEHHLFPRVPHTLHPQLAGIVRTTALECGVSYNAHPTMRDALRVAHALAQADGSSARALGVAVHGCDHRGGVVFRVS